MPDTLAQIFWLKNRRPRDWRDRHEHIQEHRVTDVRRMTTAQLYEALEQMDNEDRAAGTQLALAYSKNVGRLNRPRNLMLADVERPLPRNVRRPGQIGAVFRSASRFLPDLAPLSPAGPQSGLD